MIYRLKMKKLLPALALFILTACESSEDKDVHFETVTADKTVVISNEEMSPQCSVHLKLEQAIADNNHCGELINEAVIAKLLNIQGESNVKKAAERFADDYTEAYMRNLLPLYNEDRSDTTKRSWYEYHYIIEATAGKGTENTIVYDATIDYYEGGAHSINQQIVMNFDSKTGQQLTLADIFATGYEKPLKTILLKALKNKTGCTSMKELHNQGYLYSMDMFPTENFILGNETITFIYNPYEIAPYELGSTELTIPYVDIDKILKTSFDY